MSKFTNERILLGGPQVSTVIVSFLGRGVRDTNLKILKITNGRLHNKNIIPINYMPSVKNLRIDSSNEIGSCIL